MGIQVEKPSEFVAVPQYAVSSADVAQMQAMAQMIQQIVFLVLIGAIPMPRDAFGAMMMPQDAFGAMIMPQAMLRGAEGQLPFAGRAVLQEEGSAPLQKRTESAFQRTWTSYEPEAEEVRPRRKSEESSPSSGKRSYSSPSSGKRSYSSAKHESAPPPEKKSGLEASSETLAFSQATDEEVKKEITLKFHP